MSVNPIDQGYNTVAKRLAAFTNDHPNGKIIPRMVQFAFNESGQGYVVMGASIYKEWTPGKNNDLPDGTGFAGMPIPGPNNFTRNSEIENAETSAIGRALASIGYLSKDAEGQPSYASSDEIAMKRDDNAPQAKAREATKPQIEKFFAMLDAKGMTADDGRVIATSATGRQIHSSSQLLMSDMDAVYAAIEAAE